MKTVALIFFTILCFSQENRRKHEFDYHSFSINPILLGFYSDFNANRFGQSVGSYKEFHDTGVAFGADLTFSYFEKHLVTFSFYTGSEVNLLGTSNGFYQLNLFYGRQFPLSRTVFFESHLGVGYFHFNSRHIDTETRGQESLDTIGIPLMIKLRVMTGKRFSIGAIFQVNINNIKSLYNTGIILQWNKKTK